MKKLLTIFLILLIPITVKAEKYELDFQSPLIHTNNTYNQFYKGGYIFVDSIYRHNDSTMINYYSEDGNLIKSKIFDNYSTYGVKTDNDYIYLLGYLNGRKVICKIDENLELIDTFEFYEYEELKYEVSIIDFNIEDNKVVALMKDYDLDKYIILEISPDFENYQLKEINQDDYPLYYLYTTIDDIDTYYMQYIKVKDNYYISFIKEKYYEEIDDSLNIAALRKYNSNFELVWEKEYEDYYVFNQLFTINDNIYITISNDSNIKYNKDLGGLYKMDQDGNVLEKVIPDTSLDGVAINKDNILVSSGTYRRCLDANEFNTPDMCKSSIYHKVYSLEYKIETKTDGNGEIKAIQNSKPGVGISFEVIPKKGYVLSEVKVTDADGNTVTFTDYKFTMPSSDVLIEAVFIPGNPNTKDLINICIIVFIISAVAYVLSSTMKRNKKLI